MGMIDESISSSKKAMKIAPDFAIAHNNLAVAYLEKDDINKATLHCNKAKELGYPVEPGLLKSLNI